MGTLIPIIYSIDALGSSSTINIIVIRCGETGGGEDVFRISGIEQVIDLKEERIRHPADTEILVSLQVKIDVRWFSFRILKRGAYTLGST